jgi:hypothetical protein
MKRFFLTLLVFSVIFSVIYSGWWYYYSGKIKQYTAQSLLALSQNFGGSDSDFNYSHIDVSGFPFGFKISVGNAKFILADKDLSSDIIFEKNLAINANLIGSKYEVILPKDFQIFNKISGHPYSIKYNEPARIVIKVGIKNITNWFAPLVFDNTSDKILFVKDIKYYDDGYNISDGKTGASLISSESNFVDLSFSDADNYTLKVNLKDKDLRYLDTKYRNISGNKHSIVADIGFERVNQDTKILINEFKILSTLTSMSVSGAVISNAVEALPSGDLQIKITNYEEFLDYQGRLINYIVEKSAFPLFNIKSEEINKFKKFLNIVASEKYNDDRDLLIILRRDGGSAINIGEYNFYEALQIYKTGNPVAKTVHRSESVDQESYQE